MLQHEQVITQLTRRCALAKMGGAIAATPTAQFLAPLIARADENFPKLAMQASISGLRSDFGAKASRIVERVQTSAANGLENGGTNNPVEIVLKHKQSGAFFRLGRHAKPEEVAEAVCFLASDRSRCTNGSAIIVDGGFSS